MAEQMPHELADLVVPDPDREPGNGKPKKGKPGRPSGASRRAADREARAALESAALQAQLANQAGLASLLDTMHAVLGLPIPHEMSAALSGALLHAVEITWPQLSPVAVAWGQVAILAAGMYGPAIAAKAMMSGQPEPAPGEVLGDA